MPHLPGRLITIALATGLLTGCQPPAPVPTPLPSYRCTPEAGGDPFDCSPHQYDEMIAKDKLYTEAETVYRKFYSENVRILRAGGILEPSATLLATTSGAFQEDALDNYAYLRKNRLKVRGDDPTIRFTREPAKSKEGSEVALNVCVDGTGLEFVRQGKASGRGDITEDLAYFARIDGVLKIIGADGKVVKECT